MERASEGEGKKEKEGKEGAAMEGAAVPETVVRPGAVAPVLGASARSAITHDSLLKPLLLQRMNPSVRLSWPSLSRSRCPSLLSCPCLFRSLTLSPSFHSLLYSPSIPASLSGRARSAAVREWVVKVTRHDDATQRDESLGE
eukprot:2883444-Rhodomonas_salina.2